MFNNNKQKLIFILKKNKMKGIIGGNEKCRGDIWLMNNNMIRIDQGGNGEGKIYGKVEITNTSCQVMRIYLVPFQSFSETYFKVVCNEDPLGLFGESVYSEEFAFMIDDEFTFKKQKAWHVGNIIRDINTSPELCFKWALYMS